MADSKYILYRVRVKSISQYFEMVGRQISPVELMYKDVQLVL